MNRISSVAMLLFTCLPLVPTAQVNQNPVGGQAGSPGVAKEQKNIRVTGCLRLAGDTGKYHITGEDGRVYELKGKDLSQHLGGTITVTGRPTTVQNAKAEKTEASTKSEAGAESLIDLRVTSVKIVSS